MATSYDLVTDVPGQIEINPRLIRLNTSAEYAELTAAGFLNNGLLVNNVKDTDVVVVNYGAAKNKGFFNPSVNGATGVITLVPITTGVLKGLTNAYAGGSTSNIYTVNGITTSSIVVGSLYSALNNVAINRITPTAANQLTVIFSGDPGANTIVSYIAYI